MKVFANDHNPQRARAAFNLIEMLIATGLASLVVTTLAFLSIYGARSFQALGNYAELDAQSRNALDLASREMRQCTALIDFRTNGSGGPKWLTLTNSAQGTWLKLSWDPDVQALVMESSDDSRTLLSQCGRWNFCFYSRARSITSSNITFYPATNSVGAIDMTACKLIDMSWKCSRTILGNKMNSESVQTAQVVLRNKVR